MKSIEDILNEEGCSDKTSFNSRIIDTALEDYIHYSKYYNDDKNGSKLGHEVNMMSMEVCNYIKRKFGLTNSMINAYKDYKRAQPEFGGLYD